MEEYIFKILEQVNISQILAMGIIFWFFYSRLDRKIENLDRKIEKLDMKFSDKFDYLNGKIEKLDNRLSEKIEDVDRRLCRIEGSLSSHGHCLFNQSHEVKKAE